jgi:3-dehydroquinate synthase
MGERLDMSVQRLRVNMLAGYAYDVRIGKGTLIKLGDTLTVVGNAPANAAVAMEEGRTIVLITDSTVGAFYADAVKDNLMQAGFMVHVLTMQAGECNKNLEVATELWNAMALVGLSRDDMVVSLGGGVVGDMAGFVASTYMRGIDFAQVPTSLLSMVDASVGGKNGVNLKTGKNMVGTFSQPVHVLCDIDFLDTLPDSQWSCGFAEIAKTAVLEGEEFFEWISDNSSLLLSHDGAIVQEAIVRSIAFKANVVAADEREQGMRECLNYGHTLGHAIEALAGYGTVSHGQAVAEGMRFASRLAVEVCGTSVDFVLAQDALLDELGLTPLSWHTAPAELFEKMHADKKVRHKDVRFVLPRALGEWESVVVEPDLVRTHLDAWVRSKTMKDN